ncbi:MAG: amylosucrase [Spirochaetales bacterium]|nr:amylosucrase [Spirochaetales bacterium]
MNIYKHSEGFLKLKKQLGKYFPSLFSSLFKLYGTHPDFLYQVEDIVREICRISLDSSFMTKQKEFENDKEDLFHEGHSEVVGAVFYVDLFAGKLKNIGKKIPYLKELGITFVHLMPIFATPENESDGGYAVSSYRDIDPGLGTMNDLKELAENLGKNGISLVLDFVLNHTSHEHKWALRAKDGEKKYQEYYYIFENRADVDEYSPHLRDIFPEVRKGSFTFNNEMKSWVWTTFHSYQWDLNYGNPDVFMEMVREMLFLVEAGVKILRFDAPAFIWKKRGTSCENLPEVHTLIQAFKSVMSIAAPDVMFLSEAIVHPDEIKKYISKNECELSYNPLLMATLWESLATRKTALLNSSMKKYAQIPEGCSWINYIRCHDDIGWTFSDENAWDAGIDPYGHRIFLNDFYTGKFEGSFARGLPFQENVHTGDMRISGTCASLAGLEKALNEETPIEVDLSIARINLLYGIILSMNGFPLLYMGDETGQLNDYSYTDDPDHAEDSRWVHRQKSINMKSPLNNHSKIIFEQLKKLIFIRKKCSGFSGNNITVLDIPNSHIFCFERVSGMQDSEKIIVLANFSEQKQYIKLPEQSYDIISGNIFEPDIMLNAYQLLWLKTSAN